jgi:hypothetical protein
MASDPSPDDYDDSAPPRFRWGVPLVLGLAVGGLVGGLAMFATMRMSAERDRSASFVAEQFNFTQAVANTTGFADGNPVADSTAPLGAGEEYGSASAERSAVRRRLTLTRPLRPGAKAEEVGKEFRDQLDAEFARLGVRMTGGGSSASWDGRNEYQFSWDSGYVTRDGRRGRVDMEFDIRGGYAKVVLLLTEGR